MNSEDKKRFCLNHIEHNSIWRSIMGERVPGKLPNTFYAWQFYLRRSMFDSRFQEFAGDLFFELLVPIFNENPFQIVSCETAGVPLGMLIQRAFYENGYDLNHAAIRKEPKEYGLKNFYEGKLDLKLPIILVDDLAGSARTLLNASDTLQANGYKMSDNYVALLDKTVDTHHEAYLKGKLIHLFKVNDFTLSTKEYVSKYKIQPRFKM